MTRRLIFVLAFVAAAGAGACTSSGDARPPATTTPAKPTLSTNGLQCAYNVKAGLTVEQFTAAQYPGVDGKRITPPSGAVEIVWPSENGNSCVVGFEDGVTTGDVRYDLTPFATVMPWQD